MHHHVFLQVFSLTHVENENLWVMRAGAIELFLIHLVSGILLVHLNASSLYLYCFLLLSLGSPVHVAIMSLSSFHVLTRFHVCCAVIANLLLLIRLAHLSSCCGVNGGRRWVLSWESSHRCLKVTIVR